MAKPTPDHAKLLAEIKKAARPRKPGIVENDSYGGSGHPFYNASVPARRDIAKRWLAAHKAETDLILATAESLFAGPSHEEKTVAEMLIALNRPARERVRPKDIERWLGLLNGWAEVDGLCQNVFQHSEMLAAWPAWEKLIQRLAKSKDINKRRASLVLLTRPVHASDDPRFAAIAFAMIERLKGERDIMITKAISWLLRSLTTKHTPEVRRYLKQAGDSLPKVAVRETRTKLTTGTKSGRSQRAG
jgi:3-methyladenine DNA glycosylase AlkD